jgi:hypothetical protein
MTQSELRQNAGNCITAGADYSAAAFGKSSLVLVQDGRGMTSVTGSRVY